MQRKLHLKHPVLADPMKGNAVKSDIMGYLSSKGFSNEDVSRIYDSRMFDVIMDGMKAKANKPNLVSKKVKPSKFELHFFTSSFINSITILWLD